MTFKGLAWFGGTTFGVDVWFDRAVFRRYADFQRAAFHEDAWFREVTFHGIAAFAGALVLPVGERNAVQPRGIGVHGDT